MNPARLIKRPCVVTTAADGEPDRYNDITDTETHVATVCWLHQLGADEITVNENTQIQTSTIWLLPAFAGRPIVRIHVDAALVTGDIVGGEPYELTGPPNAARNARTNVTSHLECPVKRVA